MLINGLSPKNASTWAICKFPTLDDNTSRMRSVSQPRLLGYFFWICGLHLLLYTYLLLPLRPFPQHSASWHCIQFVLVVNLTKWCICKSILKFDTCVVDTTVHVALGTSKPNLCWWTWCSQNILFMLTLTLKGICSPWKISDRVSAGRPAQGVLNHGDLQAIQGECHGLDAQIGFEMMRNQQ